MNKLQEDVRRYVRIARKTKGQLKSFHEFNSIHKTSLPTSVETKAVFNIFSKSLKRQKLANGFPVQGRLYNLYSALVKLDSPVVRAPVKKEMIPSASLKPASIRSVPVVESPPLESPPLESPPPLKKQKKMETAAFTMDDFKRQLKEWKADHPQSKLNKETQIVYFVPNQAVENFEHFAAKLTKSTGAILEKGGIFKMRSGLKKEIMGIDKKEASVIISKVTKGKTGPYFLPINCITGSKKCNCTI